MFIEQVLTIPRRRLLLNDAMKVLQTRSRWALKRNAEQNQMDMATKFVTNDWIALVYLFEVI